MIFMLGYMSGNVVSHRCHSQVLPYVKLLLQSLRRAELWSTAWHALRGKSGVCHFFFIFYGNMAADVRAWFQGIKQSSFHPSSLASGHGQSHWFLVRTLPPEFHYKDQAGQRLYSRLDPGRRWMPGQVYRALSDRHDHLERRFYAGRLFYRQLCVALW